MTEVALAVDQRIPIRERLRHQHHRLVTSRVAVRMIFTDHVADGARRFLVFGGLPRALLAHDVHDATLHRLQAVADVRQSAVENHVHRIIEVRLLGEGAERLALDAFEVQRRLSGHRSKQCFLRLTAASASDQGRRSARLPLVSSHSRRSPERFFASSMSMIAIGFVFGVHGELHQATRFGRHGRFAQLQGAHFAETFESSDRRLAARMFGREAIENARDARHRRARSTPACPSRCDTAAASPRTRDRPAPADGSDAGTTRTTTSRCADRRSRRRRGCKPCDSAGRRACPSRDRRRARWRCGALPGTQHLARVDFPGVQDLAAQRHHRLELAIARLLGRATGRITFDQEQLAALGLLG